VTTLGISSVLLFHSVASHPVVQVAHGWPYPHRSSPTFAAGCEGYECSRRPDDRKLPWRPVSLSLSGGFAKASGAEVAAGGSGGAFGLRLGAGLVDRLSLTVACEGTRMRRGDQDESETAALLGLQWYPLTFVYFRAAAGAGVVSYERPGGGSDEAGNGLHPVFSTALGLELGDSVGFAFGLEGANSWMRLPGENWRSAQVSLVVTFF
jgi:hypothetical protein